MSVAAAEVRPSCAIVNGWLPAAIESLSVKETWNTPAWADRVISSAACSVPAAVIVTPAGLTAAVNASTVKPLTNTNRVTVSPGLAGRAKSTVAPTD